MPRMLTNPDVDLPHDDPIEAKIWSQVEKTETCWLWTGAQGGYVGRGMITWNGKRHYVTRVVWLVRYGIIPEGMYVCHHCDNPRCVRLSHLFVGKYA